MRKPLNILLSLTLIATTLMWFTSYTHYTSFGIDADTRQDGLITHHYYRVRWPGNGSIWFGGGISQRASDPTRPYEPFDLAASFLHPNPQKPEPRTMLNRIGFWKHTSPAPNLQYWLGIPAWLPVLMLGFIVFRLRKTWRYS